MGRPANKEKAAAKILKEINNDPFVQASMQATTTALQLDRYVDDTLANYLKEKYPKHDDFSIVLNDIEDRTTEAADNEISKFALVNKVEKCLKSFLYGHERLKQTDEQYVKRTEQLKALDARRKSSTYIGIEGNTGVYGYLHKLQPLIINGPVKPMYYLFDHIWNCSITRPAMYGGNLQRVVRLNVCPPPPMPTSYPLDLSTSKLLPLSTWQNSLDDIVEFNSLILRLEEECKGKIDLIIIDNLCNITAGELTDEVYIKLVAAISSQNCALVVGIFGENILSSKVTDKRYPVSVEPEHKLLRYSVNAGLALSDNVAKRLAK